MEVQASVSTIDEDTDVKIVEVVQSVTTDASSTDAKSANVVQSVSTTTIKPAVQSVSNCAMKKQQKLYQKYRLVVQILILMIKEFLFFQIFLKQVS